VTSSSSKKQEMPAWPLPGGGAKKSVLTFSCLARYSGAKQPNCVFGYIAGPQVAFRTRSQVPRPSVPVEQAANPDYAPTERRGQPTTGPFHSARNPYWLAIARAR
jgi:hypothetical protein